MVPCCSVPPASYPPAHQERLNISHAGSIRIAGKRDLANNLLLIKLVVARLLKFLAHLQHPFLLAVASAHQPVWFHSKRQA